MENGAAPPLPPDPRRPRPPLDDPPRPPVAGGGNQFGLKPISRGISPSDRLSVHAPAIGDASCAAPPARVATAVVRIRTSDRCMPYYAKGPRRRKRPSQGGLRNNSETFVSDTFVPGVIERPRRRMASAPRQNGSHGAKGSQRHRALVHHLPLAIGSVGLLALFTVLPLFDVSAYGHVDVMTGTFPQARADASGAAVDAHGQAHSRRTVHVGRTDHGSERQTTMGHGRD